MVPERAGRAGRAGGPWKTRGAALAALPVEMTLQEELGS